MTAKGRLLASLPVEPVWGAVLLAAAHLGCLDHALTVVAMASTDPFFVHSRWALQLVPAHDMPLRGPEGPQLLGCESTMVLHSWAMVLTSSLEQKAVSK